MNKELDFNDTVIETNKDEENDDFISSLDRINNPSCLRNLLDSDSIHFHVVDENTLNDDISYFQDIENDKIQLLDNDDLSELEEM